MSRLILFNKPFHCLSQFRDNDGRTTLARFFDDPALRLAGRLDYDSEGLLLLTDDGQLSNRISAPAYKLAKTYWVQVEGSADDRHLEQLLAGVDLKDGPAAAIAAKHIPPPPLWDRQPPVRFRKTVPDHWLEITITEGRNRQIRRMTAAAGLPALRLVRARIGDWSLDDLQPGDHREVQVSVPGGSAGQRHPRRAGNNSRDARSKKGSRS